MVYICRVVRGCSVERARFGGAVRQRGKTGFGQESLIAPLFGARLARGWKLSAPPPSLCSTHTHQQAHRGEQRFLDLEGYSRRSVFVVHKELGVKGISVSQSGIQVRCCDSGMQRNVCSLFILVFPAPAKNRGHFIPLQAGVAAAAASLRAAQLPLSNTDLPGHLL